MIISPNKNARPLSHAFVDAARRAGLDNMEHYNGHKYQGAWLTELAHKDGKRFSAYNAYLVPAMRRTNLKVITASHVTKHVWGEVEEDQGRKAVSRLHGPETGVVWTGRAALAGVRLWFISLAGVGLNQYFKMLMHGSRPYWVSTKVRALASETDFGVPSAHAEIGAGSWGMLVAYYRRTWAWIAAVLLVTFIGLSRLYLGVHFPQDVLAGWVLGFLTLWIFARFWEPVEARLKAMSLWSQVGLAFVVSLAMVLLGILLLFLSRDFVLPPEWIANAVHAGAEAPNPFSFSMETLITSAGTLFGACAGLAWMATRGGFNASGTLWKRAARFVVGLIGVLVLYAGLKAVFPSGDAFVPYVRSN